MTIFLLFLTVLGVSGTQQGKVVAQGLSGRGAVNQKAHSLPRSSGALIWTHQPQDMPVAWPSSQHGGEVPVNEEGGGERESNCGQPFSVCFLSLNISWAPSLTPKTRLCTSDGQGGRLSAYLKRGPMTARVMWWVHCPSRQRLMWSCEFILKYWIQSVGPPSCSVVIRGFGKKLKEENVLNP